MKTPTEMMENITAQIIEASCLLEIIYRQSNENPETDSAIACLLRSLYYTKDQANEYTDMLNGQVNNLKKP